MSPGSRAPGRAFAVAVRVPRQVRVVAAAGCDEREPRAVVGVVGQTPVFGGGAHRDRVRSARRVCDRGVALVAGGGDDDHPASLGVAKRVEQLRDVEGVHTGGELEAEVDHAGAVADREVHAPRDCRGFAFALAVEYPHGHQARAVGQAGEPDAVVGRLRDLACDKGAMTVVIDGVGARVDEVISPDELIGIEARRAAKAPDAPVGDPGVEDAATITPAPPPACSLIRFPQARGASTPKRPAKFHWRAVQPPGMRVLPGLLGTNGAGVPASASWAMKSGTAQRTSG